MRCCIARVACMWSSCVRFVCNGCGLVVVYCVMMCGLLLCVLVYWCGCFSHGCVLFVTCCDVGWFVVVCVCVGCVCAFFV